MIRTRQPVFYGEFLVDVLFQAGQEASYHPGGAPANAAATSAALGATPYLISSVGGDRLGRWLMRCASAEGIDISGLRIIDNRATSVAIAFPDGRTTEKFVFYRDADLQITEGQVEDIDPDRVGILVYGSLSLGDAPVLAGSLARIKQVTKEVGSPVMCDLNYRQSMWPSPDNFAQAVRAEAGTVDILKANATEAELLVGRSGTAAQLATAILDLGPSLAIVTAGAGGLSARTREVAVDLAVREEIPGEGLVGTGDAVAGVLAKAVSDSGLPAVIATADTLRRVLWEGMERAAMSGVGEGATWCRVVPF